jgi:hypothetical protein
MSKITYYDSNDQPVFSEVLTDEQATTALNELTQKHPNGRVEMDGDHGVIVFTITQK